MIRIAPVSLAFNPKTLWFAAGDFQLESDDSVVVETARGIELGRMAGEVFEVEQERVENLKSPLKPVLRVATDEDVAKARELEAKSAEALPIFREMAADLEAEMRPISVEFLLDGDKAVFYFEAEERVDFRELVRKLAAHFHVRIDMRQIGVRDEARMVGGIGHCGQELCCKRLGCEFCPVSIRMAKEQDLSLNPQKISGVCGRLMCCLRYEFEAYKDFKNRAPKVGASIQTPDGEAKVVDLNTPREIVTIKLEGENPVKVPLADFEEPKNDAQCPSVVGEEAWDRALNPETDDRALQLSVFSTTELTTSEKLANPQVTRRKGDLDKTQIDTVSGATRSRSRRRSTVDASGPNKKNRRERTSSSHAETEVSVSRRSRRRSTKVAADGSLTSTNVEQVPAASLEQTSRSVRRHRNAEAPAAEGSVAREGRPNRTRRDRGQNNRGGQQRNDTASARSEKSSGAEASVRPGRNSSGLRQRKQDQVQSGNNARRSAESSQGSSQKQDGSSTQRRPRRRNRGNKDATQ